MEREEQSKQTMRSSTTLIRRSDEYVCALKNQMLPAASDGLLRHKLIVDYRKRRAKQGPINIDGAVEEQVESIKFLCVQITTNYHGPNIPRQS
ncbi:unnamed protein product [Oncorhynchus mykiss]|uniref:Uncharacterized protein n=1 Tax=Oncorhynchus mykiss TaxID=8022 RepID=A0A060YIL8_ONCMY|nr:unnamed protein product [Oncorhynchus mykiss]